MKTAHVVLINEQGLTLGVSRKNDHSNFGLPGGKMDEEDNNNPMLTAIRETKEETGLDVYDLELIFAFHLGGRMGYTYLAKYKGEISSDEPHAVEWVPFQRLINGGFGKYNQMVCDSMSDLGINFQIDVDEEALEEEISDYIRSYFSGNIKFGFLRKYSEYPAGIGYTVYFDSSEDDYEESFDAPRAFDKGLQSIGGKYGVNVRLTSDYCSK
jgi:8-oxo-dGTP pyrophosphatase MutT (NUDIX family)